MSFGLSKKYIDRINYVFAAFPDIEKVVLYGSRAKGNYRNGSDIDFVIYGSNISYKEFAKISLLLDDLLIPYKIDLALINRIADSDMLDHIKRVGKIFYHKGYKISPGSDQK